MTFIIIIIYHDNNISDSVGTNIVKYNNDEYDRNIIFKLFFTYTVAVNIYIIISRILE